MNNPWGPRVRAERKREKERQCTRPTREFQVFQLTSDLHETTRMYARDDEEKERRRMNQFRTALVHIRYFVMRVSRRKRPPLWRRSEAREGEKKSNCSKRN